MPLAALQCDVRPLDERLHVITMVSNPVRFSRRYDLYRDFANYMASHNVVLTTVEVAFGDRPFVITDANNLDHVQLRNSHELWSKENAINLGIAHTIQQYPEARYFAWVDADVSFAKPNWAAETIHALQHYDFVQMFSIAHDLGPDDETISTHKGFMSCYVKGEVPLTAYDHCRGAHPGFAWAARRESLDAVGGLIDFAILGSGDKHMALALIGQTAPGLEYLERKWKTGTLNSAYARELLEWEARADRHIRRNVGYVPGTLLHRHHGPKKSRKYVERWKVLVDHGYNPDTDIKRDCQGLYQLHDDGTERSIKLRDDIRKYFRQRNENSLEV